MSKIDQIINGLKILKKCGFTNVSIYADVIAVDGNEDIGKENVKLLKENCWQFDDLDLDWCYETAKSFPLFEIASRGPSISAESIGYIPKDKRFK
jgi:hypothetical protein